MVLVGKIQSKIKTAFSLLLRKLIKSLISLLPSRQLNRKILYAFYDKRVSPTTFDFVNFIVLAEMARIRRRCDFIHIVFVGYHDEDHLTRESDAFNKKHKSSEKVTNDFIRWRLHNILLPCCSFIQLCNGLTICSSYEEAQSIEVDISRHKFPETYSVCEPVNRTPLRYIYREISNGMIVPSIRATEQSLKIVDDWIKKHCGAKKVVTITLREAKYNTARNSKIDEWAKFVAGIDKTIYCPVIVRDTYCVNNLPKEFEDCIIYENASWNTFLRMALYQSSYINLSVSNGTAALCMFCAETRYLMFKLIADSLVSSAKFLEEVHGIKSGGQPIFQYNKLQRFVWKDDDYEVINEEFNQMCKEIESL